MTGNRVQRLEQKNTVQKVSGKMQKNCKVYMKKKQKKNKKTKKKKNFKINKKKF
jgi:hypothetical protein